MPDFSTQQSVITSSAMCTRKHIDKKKIIKHTVTHFFLVILCIIFLLPIFYMITTSLMSAVESGQGKFIPTSLHFENYIEVLSPELLTFFKNTIIVVGLNVIFIPFSALFTAFAFVRCKFVGQNILFTIILSTMMIPAIVCQIPMFVVYVKIGWLNTLWPLIVPGILGGGAGNIFLARQYMRTIPSTLDEAATIDGANRFQVFFSIFMPLCKPIAMFMMITTFTGMWNDVVTPMLYLRQESTWTLALGIYNWFTGPVTGSSAPNMRMAIGMYMLVPCAIVFFIFQKQLIDGVQMGAVKG